MKKSKATRECARQLLDHVKSIPFFSEDWESYGGREMPDSLKSALEELSGAILSDDVQELVDWLEEESK